MINITEKARLEQIRDLVWRQSWAEADAECQALLDEPHLSLPAQGEVQAILGEIAEKLHAEQTIREALSVAEKELREPLPDFEGIRRKLEHAQHLEQQYHLLQWRSELQNRMNDLLRRKDQRWRLEEDRRAFNEAKNGGNLERAVKIAQDLLADAEITQQPALVESARTWLAQVGTEMHFDDLAKSVEQALDRQDYVGAMMLFSQLPSHAQRTRDLRPRVLDAEVALEYMRKDIADAREAWQAGRIEEARRVLHDLRREHPRNAQWKRLWVEFYSDVAMCAGRAGDAKIAMGNFAEALQAYRAQLEDLQSLLDVDAEDMGAWQQKEVTQLYVEITATLSEAQAAMQYRADISTAQVLCSKAVQRVEDTPDALSDAIAMLRQRVLDFQQHLRGQQVALQQLNELESLPPDSDLELVRQKLIAMEEYASSLPVVAQQQIQTLAAKTEARQTELTSWLREAHAASTPEARFTAYQHAWQVARNATLQADIVAFCLEQARQASDDAKRRVWLEHGEKIAPQNPEIAQSLLTLSLRPDFEREFRPLKSQLTEWYDSADPDPLALKTLRLEFEHLLQRFGKVDALRQLLDKTLADCQTLAGAWESLATTLKQSERLQARGEWQEVIAFLEQQRAAAATIGVQRHLNAAAVRLENRYQEATQAFVQVQALYQEARRAYQGTVETHEYEPPLRLLTQAEEQRVSAFAALENAVPVSWNQLQVDLDVLKKRVQIMQQTWAERFKSDSLVVHVQKLREILQGQPADPVAQQLLEELREQAVAELLEKARLAERNDQTFEAQEALEQALALSGDAAEIGPWLEAVRSRGTRGKRIAALRRGIENNLERSGSLKEAVAAQEELLQELAADTGDETLIEALATLLTIAQQSERRFFDLTRKIQENTASDDAQKQLETVRNAYLEALGETENWLEDLKRRRGSADGKIAALWDEAGRWLTFKRQLLFYNTSKSAAQMDERIFALRNLLQMQALAPDPGIYDSEITEMREQMLEQLRVSANKRLAEARVANAQELFTSTLESLASIEPEFYEPISKAFPDLTSRLTEPATSEGKLLAEVQAEITRATRLQAINQELEMWKSQVEEKRRENPALALKMLNDEVPTKAAPENFPLFFEGLDRMKGQIEVALRGRRKDAAIAAIRSLEITLDSVPVDADYGSFRKQFSEIDKDVLDQTYLERYEKLRERIMEIPDILRAANQAWEHGDFGAAKDYYEQALQIQSRLQYDLTFKRRFKQAVEQVAAQDKVKNLIKEVEAQISRDPQTAIESLEQARTFARQQGAAEQENEIQQFIYRAYAILRLKEAETAFQSDDIATAKYKAELALRYANDSEHTVTKKDVETFLHENITSEIENQKQARERIARVKDLMAQCDWEAAQKELVYLPAPPSDLLVEIEQKCTAAQKIIVWVKELIREGKFAEAEKMLTQARIDLVLSETVSHSLRDELSAVREKMKEWQKGFRLLLHSLGSGDLLSIQGLTSFIEEAKILAADSSAVQGLRDTAETLSQNLESHKKDFERTEKQLQGIKTLPTPEALAELANLQVQYPLKVDDTTSFQIVHDKAEEICALRKNCITQYLAALQRNVEDATEHAFEALQLRLAEAKAMHQYLDLGTEELVTFDRLYSQLEMAWQQKSNQASAEGWDEQLEAIRNRRDVDPPDQLVEELKKLGAEITQRCEATRRDTWGDLRDVGRNVTRLQKDIEDKLHEDLNNKKECAFVATREAIRAGQPAQLETAKAGLEKLLEDDNLTEESRAEAQIEIARVKSAIQDYENSVAQLDKVTQLLETLNYKQARIVLDTPLSSPALREAWVALGKVVTRLETVETLIKRAKNWSRPEEWRVGAQECEDEAQRCDELLQTWPESLLVVGNSNQILRREIERVLPQLRGWLTQAFYQQALTALRDELPAEAENLKAHAEKQGLAIGEYAQRFRNLEPEIAVVWATIALERALLAAEWEQQTQTQLETLLMKSYSLDSERRKRAQALLKLAEIRTLLKVGAVDEAALRIGDSELGALRPFNAISREVETAKTEMKKIKVLCRSLDALRVDALEGNWRADVEEAQRLAQENTIIRRSLESLNHRVSEELKALRAQANYERLETLSPLARLLHLSDLDVAALRRERDGRFKAEYAQAQALLSQDLPEEALSHVEFAERLSAGAQREDVRVLTQELAARRIACRAADDLLSEVQLDLSQGNYGAAAEKYREAWGKAPRRAAVVDFADRVHGEWWAFFESSLAEAAFTRAEALARRALQFGFKKQQWEEALADLRSGRQKRLITLLETLVGPGCGEQDGDLVITEGLLANPDSDLETAREQLRQARSWLTDIEDDRESATLRRSLDLVQRELETRIQLMGEVRLDMRQGWDALARGEVQIAQKYFKSASQRLNFEHPEVGRWCNFADLLLQVRSALPKIQNHAEEEGLVINLHERHIVQCPGWKEVERAATEIKHCFTTSETNTLLGVEGQQHQREIQHWVAQWSVYIDRITYNLVEMQRFYDQGISYYDQAGETFLKILAALRTLRQLLDSGNYDASDVVELARMSQETLEPGIASTQPEPDIELASESDDSLIEDETTETEEVILASPETAMTGTVAAEDLVVVPELDAGPSDSKQETLVMPQAGDVSETVFSEHLVELPSRVESFEEVVLEDTNAAEVPQLLSEEIDTPLKPAPGKTMDSISPGPILEPERPSEEDEADFF